MRITNALGSVCMISMGLACAAGRAEAGLVTDGRHYEHVWYLEHLQCPLAVTGLPADQSMLSGPADGHQVEKLIRDLEGERGSAAVSELARIGKSAVPPLIRKLTSTMPKVRQRAAAALGLIGDPEAASPLGRLTSDLVEEVRACAFDALISLLNARVESPAGEVTNGDAYMAARGTLVTIGSASIEPLLAALASGSPGIRRVLPDVLWPINDPRVVDPLIRALSDPDSHVR